MLKLEVSYEITEYHCFNCDEYTEHKAYEVSMNDGVYTQYVCNICGHVETDYEGSMY